jgi:hypothetical protein
MKRAGIIYLHKITDNRLAGFGLKNLEMFQALCGRSCLRNVVLATTMWDKVMEPSRLQVVENKELQLKTSY